VAGIIAAFASTIRGKTITTTAIIRNSVTAPLDMRAVVAGAFTVAVVVAAGAIAEFF